MNIQSDGENQKPKKIPKQFLNQLWEFSNSYLLFNLTFDGNLEVYSRCNDEIHKIALESLASAYMINVDNKLSENMNRFIFPVDENNEEKNNENREEEDDDDS